MKNKEEYEKHVNRIFRGKKLKNLLALEVPSGFINRQLNDTRYISKKLLEYLDPFVRTEQDIKGIKSPKIVAMVGGITHQLKNDWGLHKMWKQLLSPRFKRLNLIHKTEDYYKKDQKGIHLSGYINELKRLDHRHHALDALIVACCTVNHITYINSLSNENHKREFRPKLFKRENGIWTDWMKPWNGFTQETKNKLNEIIISFKTKKRIINKTINYYQKYVEIDGTWVKSYVKQENTSLHWAVRQSLHKESIHGRITLREYYDVSIQKAIEHSDVIANGRIKKEIKKRIADFEGDIKLVKKDLKKNPLEIDEEVITRVTLIRWNNNYTASRTTVDDSFDEKKINKVANPDIRKELLDHLQQYPGDGNDRKNDAKKAFSQEGLEAFNKDRLIPIYKVRLYEDKGKKFALSPSGQNATKYAEAAKGTNLFFQVEPDEETGALESDKNSSLALTDVIESLLNRGQDEGIQRVEDLERETNSIFLSPDDLVYVTMNNDENKLPITSIKNTDLKGKIYKMVSCTKQQCYFIPHSIATPIINNEIGTNNKNEKLLRELLPDGTDIVDNQVFIKRNFIKLKINRIGKIIT